MDYIIGINLLNFMSYIVSAMLLDDLSKLLHFAKLMVTPYCYLVHNAKKADTKQKEGNREEIWYPTPMPAYRKALSIYTLINM